MPRKLIRMVITTLIVATSSLGLAACGSPSRSVASYCSYFYGQGSQLRNRWIQSTNNAGQNPFAALSSVFADLPEAANFFHQLSLHAPESIAPDVQVLADALQRIPAQAGAAATDPLGALAGGLVDGIETSGAEQRVNAFTERECGRVPGTSGGSGVP
jgi:hypothetical protein